MIPSFNFDSFVRKVKVEVDIKPLRGKDRFASGSQKSRIDGLEGRGTAYGWLRLKSGFWMRLRELCLVAMTDVSNSKGKRVCDSERG